MTLERQKLVAAARTYRAIFMSELRAAPGPWDKLAMTMPSTGPSNVYNFLNAAPIVQEWLGNNDRILEKVKAGDFTVTNQKWQNGFVVTREDVEDDRLMLFKDTVRQMARGFDEHRNNFLFATMEGGFADDSTMDGQYFFDTDHQWESETAQSNKSVLALSAANFDTVYNLMIKATDSKGQFLNVVPTDLFVPPALRSVALGIVQKQVLDAGETNINKGIVNVHVIPQLDATATQWFLFDLSKSLKPYIYQDRVSAEFIQRTDPKSDSVFIQDEYQYGGRARYTIANGIWQLAYGSTGAGS